VKKLYTCLFSPVDNASLVFVRISFGVILCFETIKYLLKGWVASDFILPLFHFTYWGFSWIKPWPGMGMTIHFMALAMLSFCIMLGLFYRISTILFFLGFTYWFLLDEAFYLNHFYLISLLSFLLIFMPAHQNASLDTKFFKVKRSDTAPAWALWLLRFQLFILYFYGGIAKLQKDWFRGEPMRTWLSELKHIPPFLEFLHSEWAPYFFSYSGLLLDLLIVPLLLWKKTRIPMFIIAVLFHLTNAYLFQIGIFPWLMIPLTTLFFSPSWCRRLFSKKKGVIQEVQEISLLNTRQKMILTFISLYAVIQLLVPLRHHLYPGNINWTEEGSRFAWHMKSRDKKGFAIFVAYDPVTQKSKIIHLRAHYEIDPKTKERVWVDPPKLYLNHRRQIRNVIQYPGMIVQFAHYLKEELKKEGFQNAKIRAHVEISMNGRPRQLMIDPRADLTKIKRTLKSARWIVPLREN